MQLVTEKLQEKCSEDTQMGGKGFSQETSRIPLGLLTMHPKKQKYHCSYQPVHIQLTVDMLWWTYLSHIWQTMAKDFVFSCYVLVNKIWKQKTNTHLQGIRLSESMHQIQPLCGFPFWSQQWCVHFQLERWTLFLYPKDQPRHWKDLPDQSLD